MECTLGISRCVCVCVFCDFASFIISEVRVFFVTVVFSITGLL